MELKQGPLTDETEKQVEETCSKIYALLKMSISKEDGGDSINARDAMVALNVLLRATARIVSLIWVMEPPILEMYLALLRRSLYESALRRDASRREIEQAMAQISSGEITKQ